MRLIIYQIDGKDSKESVQVYNRKVILRSKETTLPMELTLINWLLALLPVIIILILMLGPRWGGSKAGAVGWLACIVIAVVFFGAGPSLIAYTQVKGILLTLDVLYIIWTALLLYHVANEAGAINIIGQNLKALTADRVLQGLLLGWLFASFLQGMGGFGVPVAVTAPLLVGLGFTPIQAVVMACLGHGWAVNFGSMATSFQTLLAVTNLPGPTLAPDAAILLGLASIACGSLVAFIAGGWKGFVRTFPYVLLLAAVMGGVQYLLVTNGIWTLGASGGAMAGLAVGIFLPRLPTFKKVKPEEGVVQTDLTAKNDENKRSLPVALSVYGVLIVLAFGLNLIQPISKLVNQVQFTLSFPAYQTSQGWETAAELGRKINIFGHPGAILFYSAVIAYLIYSKAGYFKPGASKRILEKTARGAVNSSLGIVAMVGMSVIMSSTGMTNILAQGLSVSFGKTFYPFIASFIGALGAFITGSNNNSNVLFAALQMRTAQLLGLSVPLILGAQTAGGSLGSIMAPAKVIVGCSTVGLGDNEGAVMGKMLLYGMIPVLFVAILTVVFALT
jgi:lactate permease